MKSAFRLGALALTALLAACGGDDSSNKTIASAITGAASPTLEGFYQGTTASGDTMLATMLESGEYYILFFTSGVVYSMAHGTGTSNAGYYTSTDGFNFNYPKTRFSRFTVGAYSASKAAWSGTMTNDGTPAAFNTTYDATYEQPASLSAVAGSYAGSLNDNDGITAATFTVDADGTLSGTAWDGRCTFSGRILPRASGKNVFDFTLTSPADSACYTGPSTGVAVGRATGHGGMDLYMMSVPERQVSYTLVGHR